MIWRCPKAGELAGKAYLVTGGNAGLGFATARHLLRAGARVIFTARDPQRGQAALDRLRVEGSPLVQLELLDLASLDSVAKCTERIRQNETFIDAVILNAGVAMLPKCRSTDGYEMHFAVNHLGHFALTLPLVDLAARFVITSSGGARQAEVPLPFADLARRDSGNPYAALQVYCDSKLANVLFAGGLRQRRPDRCIVLTHPGFTDSDLQRHSFRFRVMSKLFAQSADKGALANVRAAVDPSLRSPGKHEWVCPGGKNEMRGNPVIRATVPPYGADREAQDHLWQLSEALTGVSLPNPA